MKTIIKNANIINEGKQFVANLLIEGNIIAQICTEPIICEAEEIIDATGLMLLPGVIDDQVHFRDPGLTAKGDIYTESRAAAAGGVTSFMDMPNTIPQTTTQQELENKFAIAASKSLVNYSFYLGATNDNLAEIEKTNPAKVCGVKLFMGSSTGNMLVKSDNVICDIFRHSPVLVAVHCENDDVISERLRYFTDIYGEDIPMEYHADIRNEEACYSSSARAVELAVKANARLHLLHLSTAKEMGLLSNSPLKGKKITAEVCTHHLWFNRSHYQELGSLIKWNPSIKEESDRLALIDALKSGHIDIVATDHAPHTLAEKRNIYTKCPSGAPMVQHSLVLMLELALLHCFSYPEVVEYMCHKPAALFQIQKRGYLRKSYYADLVLVKPHKNNKVKNSDILYKCGWSPLENCEFSHKVVATWINGEKVFDKGNVLEKKAAMPLRFDR